MINSNNFARGPNKMVKNSSQISRSAPNIENFGSGLKKRKEVFCSIGMLEEKVGQSLRMYTVRGDTIIQILTMCGALIVAPCPIILSSSWISPEFLAGPQET